MRVSVGACLVLFLGFGNVITKYILNVSEPCCFEILIILHLRFRFLKFHDQYCSADDSTISVASLFSLGAKKSQYKNQYQIFKLNQHFAHFIGCLI